MRAPGLLAVLLVAGLSLTGCVSTVDSVRQSAGPAATIQPGPSATSAPATNCTPTTATASFDPSPLYDPDDFPADSTMARIRKQGYLRVGTAGDVPLWGDRGVNGQLSGFDIELSQEIAKAIFGDDKASRVRFLTINYAQRIPFLQAGKVDIVAHTMTINCTRWNQIDFSSDYYDAGQRILVRTDSGITSVSQLANRQVCVAAGSTNLANIKAKQPAAKLTVVSDLGNCLVAFQQGTVAAITGDDTVLAGFASLDPSYAAVVGPAFSAEPYGIGVAYKNNDLTRFINAVLAQLRSNGGLKKIYDDTMGTVTHDRNWSPPAATQGRTRAT